MKIVKNFKVSILALLLLTAIKSFALKPGDTAPDFELPLLSFSTQTTSENKISLNEILKGDEPVILSFFATWCNTCLDEIKDLSEITKEYKVKVYLISVNESESKVDKFLKKHQINFPVLMDPKAQKLGKKYDLFRGAFLIIPTMVVISPSGSVEYVSESYSKEKLALLKNVLNQIKEKKWIKPVEIALFFTGSINGYLESCNCYKHPYGGFVKFITWIKQQKKKYPENILVDSGDFLPHSASDISAEFVLKALELADYDAIAVGDQDIHSGFIQFAKNKKLPFIASNISFCKNTSSESCQSLGASDKVININGIRIRIISFVHPDSFFLYPEEFTSKIKIKGLKEILKDGKNADFLILLSHSGVDEDKKIAEEFKELDLIIGGHSQTLLNEPLKKGNILIVQSGGNLQYAGKLILRFDKDKKLRDYSYELFPLVNEIPDDPQVKSLIQEYKNIIQQKR